MTPRFQPTFATKLALAFVALTLAPVVILFTLLEEQSEQQLLHLTETHLRDLARDRRKLLEHHLDSIQDTTAFLSQSDLVRDCLSQGTDWAVGPVHSPAPNWDLLENLVLAVQERSWGKTHHFFLVDATGRIVLSPFHGQGEGAAATRNAHAGDSISEPEVLLSALATPYVTPFFRFRERDHYHLLISHPVKDPGGKALGAVFAEVAIDEINRLLTTGFDLGTSGRIALATPSGQRVIHDATTGKEALSDEGVIQALRTQQSTLTEHAKEDGRRVFGIFLPSLRYPWVICIEVDYAQIVANAAEPRRFLYALLGLTVLSIGLGGMLLGKWFGLPLRRCSDAARRISEGDLDRPIPVSGARDEIGVLERATETMRARLCEHIHTLDSRVEEQTRQLKLTLEKARISQDRYALAVRGSKDGLWDWDLETNKIYFAPRWKELLGLQEDELGDAPEDWFRLIVPNQAQAFEWLLLRHIDGETQQFDTEIEMLHADGRTRWMLCRAAAIRDEAGKATRLAGSLADITELKEAQKDLRKLANHDRLTGLPNKELFADRLNETIARSKRNLEGEFAVLFFDFDRFKVINDSLGHNVGDALLVSIAQRFRQELREVDTAARFGGDEFVVILDDVAGLGAAEVVCGRLLKTFAQPHNILGHEVVSTASIGLVMNEPQYERAEEMIRDADAAMYQAKMAGRAQYRVFDKGMHSNAVQRLNLEHDLRHSDMDVEFELYYQSIVALDTGEITGFEALVRWEHPELGLVPPDRFIPIAEETGLIVPLGRWILRTATRQLLEWQAEFGRRGDLFMNVNLARRQLLHPSLKGTLEDLMQEFGFEMGDLKLEITETTVMDERHDMLPAMQVIRDLGFPLAMDDFGTGHSSLSCLHCFPIDVLKIDRSFISNLGESREFTAVVQAIVTLAHHLDLDVVAEGIETPEQLAQLQVLGCLFAQGYLFSRPLPAPQATELLRTGLPRVA